LLCGALGQNNAGICEPCAQDLPWHQPNHCEQCALPLAAGESSKRCGNCLQHPPAFKRTDALFRYAFPIDRVLHAYKYQERLTIANFFATHCLQTFSKPDKIDGIIPMPLHPDRLQTRGFNQSLEIARLLHQAWELPLDVQACQRIKNTPPQASLKLKDRIKNVSNAFECYADLSHQHVLVIDDVMTTGASLNALAKVILQAGAESVHCLVMARTIPHNSGDT